MNLFVVFNCIGIATSKTLAKIASDFNKPNGHFVVEGGKERKFVEALPIRKVN